MLSKLIARYNILTDNNYNSDLNKVESWRSLFVDILYTIGLLIIPLTLFIMIPYHFMAGNYYVVLADIGFIGVVLSRFIFKSLTDRTRALILIITSYLLTTLFFTVLGPGYARSGWIVMTCVLAALFMGNRIAFIFAGLNTITLTALYFLINNNYPPWSDVFLSPPSKYFVFIVMVTILSLIPSVMIGFMIKHLNRAETAARKSAQDLKKAQSYIRNIINSMPSVLIGVDKNLHITQWNKEAEKRTGISEKNADGKKITAVFPFIETITDMINETILTGTPYTFERMQRDTDDATFFEDVSIYPLISSKIEGAVIRIDNVSARVKIEELMIQSEKMISVGGLAAGMAHEINNPLAGVIQNAQNLEKRLLDKNLHSNIESASQVGITFDLIEEYANLRQIPRMLSQIMNSGFRMSKIVNNMLSFARKSENITSSNDISAIIDNAIELAKTDYNTKKEFDFKSIKILKQYEKDLPLIHCDETKIQQVFLNILTNGAHAMAQNSKLQNINPQFRISIKTEKGMIIIKIKDNGPGIPKEVQKRIFEPFFTTKPVGEGTGLGLSVSYFIITENHNGVIEVDSQPDCGATFIIKLPYIKGN
ncbi:MAG: PAS domain S-box protein [Deltaproteobacteria bacterium]|nr:PAS domain S-box protein [Deltaproteobacteria bacterium]